MKIYNLILERLGVKFQEKINLLWALNLGINVLQTFEPATIQAKIYPFIHYMPNKLDKFGIKYWFLTDVKSKYCLNALLCCGKDDARISNQYLGEFVCCNRNSGTNITCNNYFSSISLVENSKNINITFVGTIRKNRRELPPSIQRRNQIHSTRVYKNSLGDILMDYQAKKNKNVLLLSTMHQDVIISDTQKRKPDQILFYNANKVGVDLMGIMCRICSTGWATRRWPAHAFFIYWI
ncbi:hypothetical protein J437_LFUL019511 [Ladona fulva]|uniref:PiggyBac transposable element-derived protein domain-containing protein n=1 Tax=Ladona fulva TaxID=123851 RepID=A0A8K0KY09_LADFU|nr:hypothetical protein J437_LFUL019511 [Ladona fulva]